MLLLAMFYPLVSVLLPVLSVKTTVALHFTHAFSWALFHCFGLGFVLKAQGETKFLVRHYLKHYHYPQRDGSKGAVREAFANWKVFYNLSVCMTYSKRFVLWFFSFSVFIALCIASFFGLVWKTYSIPSDWTVGNELLRHTLGAVSHQ